MELRQLRYFIVVADAQSITAAARKLHVVQSAISHQMANLESELGVELLLRHKTGVKLTAAGQLLYRHAVAVVKHVEAASREVRLEDKEIRGKVAVGLPNSTAAVLALPLLKAVRSELPYVDLTIMEGLSGLLKEQLTTGRLDLSILFDTDLLRGFQVQLLLTERLHFVSADPKMRRAFARASTIDLRQVMKRPLVLPPQPNGIRDLLEREALRVDLRPHIIANITGVGTMLAAVKAGLADTVMMAVNASVGLTANDLLVIPVGAPPIERRAGLFESAQFALPTAVARVRDITLRLVDEMITAEMWPGARLLDPKVKPI